MNNQTMTPEVYESKRNDLIALLESILKSATDLSDSARKDLNETRDKLTRNSFEIVLVGEFQGGKSTTFNTICDGREISPRGQGIKTSACKISAQSIRENEAEHADLRWKSDDELILTMIDFLRSNLANNKEASALFNQKDEHGDYKFPPLSDSHVRKLAEQAIHSEWQRYRESPKNYDAEQKGLLDLLKISTLILKFYGRPELEALRTKTRISIDELKTLVVFPQDWEIRWSAGGESTNWEFNEVPFVFLGNVSCYIHCKNLERLGCVITDCPGLFAGPWDTRVAQEAMYNGDAILYLIAGDKAIKEADLRAITEIIKAQQGHKVVFAINAKATRDVVANAFRPVDFAQIKQRGYNLEKPETIEVFNALLANAGRSGQRGKDVSRALQTYLGLDFLEEKDMEKAKTILGDANNLSSVSDFPAILAKIETDIITKKFKRVLVDGGTSHAGDALNALSGNLEAKEKAATTDLDAIKVEVEKARAELLKFQEFVTEEVQNEFKKSSSATVVANNFAQSVFLDNIEAIAQTTCSVVAQAYFDDDEIKNEILNVIRKKQKDCPKLQDAISKAISEILLTSAQAWLVNVQQGANATFASIYTNALTNLDCRFHEKWQQLVKNDSSGLLKGFELPGNIEVANLAPIGLDFNADLQTILKKARFMDRILLAIVSIIGGLLFILLGTGPLGVLILTSLVVVGYLIGREKLKAALIKWLRPEIIKSLHQQSPEIGNSLQDQFKISILKEILDGFVQKYKESLSEQLVAFENRVKETLALKEEKADKQKQIAEWARKVREKQIDPARGKIAEFHKGLTPYFKETSAQ